MLRYKYAISSLQEFAEGTTFKSVIPDVEENELVPADQVKRVIFCTGKVYYDLWLHKKEKNIKDVAICRIEEISPFPFEQVATEVLKYKNADVMWVQEEPQNYGFWYYFYFRAMTALKKHGRHIVPKFSGRRATASPATGHTSVHEAEQAHLIANAFSFKQQHH